MLNLILLYCMMIRWSQLAGLVLPACAELERATPAQTNRYGEKGANPAWRG